MKGKQSVRKGAWYISRKRRRKIKIIKKKRQRGRCVPIGILVSAAAAASFIGEIAKPIFKNVFDETKHTVRTMCYVSKGSIT